MENFIKTSATEMEVFRTTSICCRNNSCGKSLQINLKNIEKKPFYRSNCCARKGCLLAAKLVDLYGLQLKNLKSVKMEGDKKYHYLMVDSSTITDRPKSTTIVTPPCKSPPRNGSEEFLLLNALAFEEPLTAKSLHVEPVLKERVSVATIPEESVTEEEVPKESASEEPLPEESSSNEQMPNSPILEGFPEKPLQVGEVPVRPYPGADSVGELLHVADMYPPSDEESQALVGDESEIVQQTLRHSLEVKPGGPRQMYNVNDNWSDDDDEYPMLYSATNTSSKSINSQPTEKADYAYSKPKNGQPEEQSMLLLPPQPESQSRKGVNSSVNWKMVSDASLVSIDGVDITSSMEEAINEAREKAQKFRKGTEMQARISTDAPEPIEIQDNPLALAPGGAGGGESLYKSSICLESSTTDTKCCGFIRKKKKRPKKDSATNTAESEKPELPAEPDTVPPEVMNLDKPKKEAKFTD